MFARLLLILIGTVLPCAALAVDLNLSLNATAQYDANVTRRKNNEEGDFAFRIGPTIRVRDEFKRFNYHARYTPTYQKFLSENDLDKLSHNAGATLSYQLGNKTHLSLNENFSLTQAISQASLAGREDAVGQQLGPELETETRDGDIYRNRLNFLARHSFTPRLVGQVNVNHDYFDGEGDRTSKNSILTGLTSLTYALGARDRIGGGAGVAWQQFDGIQGQPGSDSYTYRVFASWLHNFGESTTLSIRGGPALITTNQDKPDDEGIDNEFLFLVVDADDAGTVQQVYENLNRDVPAKVADINGNVLNLGDMIAAGSVLVPSPFFLEPNPNPMGPPFIDRSNGTPCIISSTDSDDDVFSEANCEFSVVIQPTDGTTAGGQPFVDFVQSETVDFEFPPGQNPGSNKESSLTFFGEISLIHNWNADWSSSASYSRSDSSASSLGSATIADRATFQTNWNPTNRLSLHLRADWLQRKSANDIENTFRQIVSPDGSLCAPNCTAFDSQALVAYSGVLTSAKDNRAVDTTYYSISGHVGYRVTRDLLVTARVTYQNQDTKSASTTSNSTFGDVIGFLGLRYDLYSFHF